MSLALAADVSFQEPVGMFSSDNSKDKSVGSLGRSCCLIWFVALAMFTDQFGQQMTWIFINSLVQ